MKLYLQFLLGVIGGMAILNFTLTMWPIEAAYILNTDPKVCAVIALICFVTASIFHSTFEDNKNEQPKSNQSKQ